MMSMRGNTAVFVLGPILALLAGCSSYGHYRFGPSPQELLLNHEGGNDALADVLVSARGFESRDVEGEDDVWEMHFRVRVENRHREAIELVSGEFLLVDANLVVFGAPRVSSEDGGESLVIAPAQALLFDLYFPLPSGSSLGDLDLSGLNLRFALAHETGLETVSASFEREVPVHGYYDPYWHGHYHYGFGLGFTSRVRYCD